MKRGKKREGEPDQSDRGGGDPRRHQDRENSGGRRHGIGGDQETARAVPGTYGTERERNADQDRERGDEWQRRQRGYPSMASAEGKSLSATAPRRSTRARERDGRARHPKPTRPSGEPPPRTRLAGQPRRRRS